MNDTLKAFARKTLKAGLAECSKDQQHFFKRIYADDLDLPIDVVVDRMPENKLDWAMQQVENTIRKNVKRELDFLTKQDIVVPQCSDKRNSTLNV